MTNDNFTVGEIKAGYCRDSDGGFVCISCGKRFVPGEVYPIDGRFFEAESAVRRHIESHGPAFERIREAFSRSLALTENQLRLLDMMQRGKSDREIADETGTAQSTVRHQRFTFREKAKQARVYLALYELAEEKFKHGKEQILPVHKGATMVDDRYIITEKERETILKTVFSSLEPLKLAFFSRKEKKKLVILTRIAEQFEHGKSYAEREINAILQEVYDDYVTLRRYLIEYGFLDRTRDGREYWLK